MSHEMRAFARPGKDKMLKLVQAAGQAFVTPIQVEGGITLRLLTGLFDDGQEVDVVVDCYANYIPTTPTVQGKQVG